MSLSGSGVWSHVHLYGGVFGVGQIQVATVLLTITQATMQ